MSSKVYSLEHTFEDYFSILISRQSSKQSLILIFQGEEFFKVKILRFTNFPVLPHDYNEYLNEDDKRTCSHIRFFEVIKPVTCVNLFIEHFQFTKVIL